MNLRSNDEWVDTASSLNNELRINSICSTILGRYSLEKGTENNERKENNVFFFYFSWKSIALETPF